MRSLRYQSLNRIRLRLNIPVFYDQEPILSRLVSDFNLVVNITSAKLSKGSNERHCDVEIQGTPEQINRGLIYLRSLNLGLIGKPNTVEEDWY